MPDLIEVIHSAIQHEKGEHVANDIVGVRGSDEQKEPGNKNGTSTPPRRPARASTANANFPQPGGITPSGTPGPITYDLPRSGSGSNVPDIFLRNAGKKRDSRSEDGVENDIADGKYVEDGDGEGNEKEEEEEEGVPIDPDRIMFKRANSDFKGGLDLDDPEIREKVSFSESE